MAIAKGFAGVAAFKPNTNTWGSGLAVAVGAGDGIEFSSESLVAAAELIEDEQVSGNVAQLPGVKGNELHAGDLAMDLYYQGNERFLAQVLASVAAPAQQGGTAAYKHVMKPTPNTEGKAGTLVIDKQVKIWEWPFVKVGGFTIECEQGQMAKLTCPLIPFGLNLNEGTASAVNVVAAVTPADGALTVIGAPFVAPSDAPSPLRVTVVDANASITTLILTIVATDRDDNVITLTYSLVADGLIKNFSEYIKTVISATISGFTGTAVGDTISIGTTNGINNTTAIANISLPSTRDFALFSQLEVLMNVQSAGALASTDERFVTRFRMQVDLQMAPDDVTTRFGNRIDEPVIDGFVMVTGGISFSKLMDENVDLYINALYNNKTKHKAKVTFSGPIAATPYPFSWTFYLNNIQFREPNAQTAGPQRVPFDVEFKAHRALSIPTGFPTGYTDAITAELINLVSTQL